MENVLRIEKILDFCDVPQLFVARDAFDTLYLCLLYEDELLCRYTGIRISARRLEDFLSGGIDLRSLFIHPENKHEYFDVGDMRENVVINLPVKDRSLLAELVRKFGWACM